MALTLVQRTPTTIDALELDASLTETHDVENEVTEHPVEAGYVITDHVRRKPQRVTIEGIVSNTPVISKAVRFATGGDSVEDGRAESAYATLMAIFDSAKVISIITGLKQYDNMVVESLRFPRDKNTGSTLRFTACCKEIRVAASQTVKVTQPRGAGQQHSGKKSAAEAPAPIEKPSSLLFQTKQYVQSKFVPKP
jgi:hypothetical protein